MEIVILSLSMVVVTLLVLIGIPAALTWIYEKSRSSRLQRIASELGLEFRAGEDQELTEAVSRFAPFDDGELQCASNVVYADTSETRIRICDFSYAATRRNFFGQKQTLSHGITLQTVIYVSSTQWNLPSFQVLPKTILVLLEKMMGMQDLLIREDPKFFAYFALQGADEKNVRELFSAEVRNCFSRLRGNQVQGVGNSLLIFSRRRLSAPRIRELMRVVVELHLYFSRFRGDTDSED